MRGKKCLRGGVWEGRGVRVWSAAHGWLSCCCCWSILSISWVGRTRECVPKEGLRAGSSYMLHQDCQPATRTRFYTLKVGTGQIYWTLSETTLRKIQDVLEDQHSGQKPFLCVVPKRFTTISIERVIKSQLDWRNISFKSLRKFAKMRMIWRVVASIFALLPTAADHFAAPGTIH